LIRAKSRGWSERPEGRELNDRRVRRGSDVDGGDDGLTSGEAERRQGELGRVQKEDLFDEPRELVARARRRLAARGFVVPAREISGVLLPRR
jgi:hypothetical protein